jgi:hypothetical protein
MLNRIIPLPRRRSGFNKAAVSKYQILEPLQLFAEEQEAWI